MSLQAWRTRVARHTPVPLRQWIAQIRLRQIRRRNTRRHIDEVFSEIYASGQWGGREFDSGSGSQGSAATRYAAFIRELLHETGARTVVDVGCGDFRVASQFVSDVDSYLGIDVVETIIERNTTMFGRPGISFSKLDATSYDLPQADICLVRQVLQHLSNRQISEILFRCRKYPLVVVTEHWPAAQAATVPNRDKPHGPDTRLDSGSWVDISRHPFDCAPVDEVLCVEAEVMQYTPGETIRTHLWRPGRDHPR
jgi:SAM-dependent methyltransferase